MKVFHVLIFFLVFLTVSLSERLDNKRADDHEIQDWFSALRRGQDENQVERNQIVSNRRNFAKNFQDEYLSTLRQEQQIMKRNKGNVITLKNYANMAVRLIVVYTSSNGEPHLKHKKSILLNETTSITVPSTANYIGVLVEQYSLDGLWHVTYTTSLNHPGDLCLSVNGDTIESTVDGCSAK